MTKIKMWMNGSVCHALVWDENGNLIDTMDLHRKAVENWAARMYPSAEVIFVTDKEQIRQLNNEWNACVRGN